jgi:CBS domain-containing protein
VSRRSAVARVVLERIVMTTTQTRCSSDAAQRRLPLRVRTILGGGGEIQAEVSLYCPARETSLGIEACEGCARFGGLHFDKERRETSAVCGYEDTEQDRAARSTDVGGCATDASTPVAAIMSRDVVCVRPDVGVDAILALLVERSIGSIPVVDASGKPVGIVSKSDLLRAERDAAGTEEIRSPPRRARPAEIEPGCHVFEPSSRTARDLMTPLVLSLHESSNIGQAASLMAYEGVHRVPVVSTDGAVVGIVSSMDVMRWFGRQSGYLIPEGHTPRHG